MTVISRLLKEICFLSFFKQDHLVWGAGKQQVDIGNHCSNQYNGAASTDIIVFVVR